MIKEKVDAAIAVERARHENVGNDTRGYGPARGQDATPATRKCTFARFMKCNPTAFHGTEGFVELQRWFEKTESVFEISECAEGKKVRFAAATLQGPALTWWNTKVATMGLETMNRMPWTEIKFNELALMCLRMVEPERVKVDAYIRGLTDNINGEVTSSKPANLNEAVRMAHKLMKEFWKERSKSRRAFKVEIVVDPEQNGPNVVTGASYEVELADGRVISTNTVLKGCTLNLVNHVFEIDLLPIQLSTFDVIIGMDWLVKHDAVIVCGEKVVHIPLTRSEHTI
ncbi:putative reverse transcriptase domain-containing protein [Tanacetum coccineum]